MNIVILGPQGCGKGTQAELLAKRFGLEHIDMGKTLREIAKLDTPLGKKIYSIQNITKTLIPDQILNEILHLKLSSLPREQGIVLDGAPRTLGQAKFLEEWMQEFGKKIDRVIFINISGKESIERISKRWNCGRCKEILIMGKDMRSKGDKCPKCGGEITQREDDTEEGVKKRLAIFKKETLPAIAYYRRNKLLLEIDGERSINDIFKQIIKKLNGQR